MVIVLGEVGDRSKAKAQAQARERAVRPSIREVRLVGIAGGRPAPEAEGAPEPASGRRVTRSGRAYRIEAAQVRTGDGGGDGPLFYVHLSALTEG
jgi:hypothetical protein